MRSLKKDGGYTVALFLLLLHSAQAQSVTARLTGIVKDSTGSTLPGATVVAQSVDSGRTWQTVTQATTGGYNFGSLPPGRYSVSAELTGFKKAVNNDVLLEVDQIGRLDLVLELGNVMEEVIVRGSPVLQTDSSVVGTMISSTTAPNLPLNGRNFMSLTLMTPGVVTGDLNGFTSGQRGETTGGRPFVNGNRKETNNFQLDGIDNNAANNNTVTYQPNVDAIQEFRMVTANAPAEFGNFQGAIVNVTFKSGTNEIHGSAFEFYRSDKLNANRWQTVVPGASILPRAELQQNVFGGTIGGPLMKNKVFFFADYQGTRRRPGFTETNITVIPEAFRRGDFAALPQQLFNPYTARTEGGRVVRDPFPNNQIPLALFSPVAKALFARPDLYPLPLFAGLTNNYTNPTRSNVVDNNQGDVKLDIKPRSSDDIALRYSYGHQTVLTTNALPILFENSNDSPYHSAAVSWNHIFSSLVLNELRVGGNRITNNSEGGHDWGHLGNLGEALGIAGSNREAAGLPLLNFTGASNIGDVRNINLQVNTTIQVGDNLSINHGDHLFKVGGLWIQYRTNAYFTGNQGQLGRFNFGGQYTRDLNNTQSQGSGIADFILGLPTLMARGNPESSGRWEQHSHLFAGFVQDDWRIKSNLTLNLGLRYEYQTPQTEIHDRQTNFDLVTHKQLFPGQDGVSRATYRMNKKNFQPRLGFAWSIDSRTVLRGAYTVSSFMEAMGIGNRLTQNYPFFIDFSQTNASTTLPPPLTEGYASLIAPKDPYQGKSLKAFGAEISPAISQQWNLTAERQLTSKLTWNLGYLGQHATHVMIGVNANQAPLGSRVKPFAQTLPTIADMTLSDSQGRQIYHAMQTSARQRFADGFELLAAYTWSKVLTDAVRGFFTDLGQAGSPAFTGPDPYNRKADYGPAHFDVTHAASLAFLYDLPFGKGRAHMTSGHPVMEALLGGWSVSGMAIWHTGMPLTISAPDVSGGGSRAGSSRPDLVPGQSLEGPKKAGLESSWLNPAAFRSPAAGTFGNAGVGIVRGPGTANLDLSLMKRFRLGDQKRYVELRADAFNATNSPIFNAPSISFGGGNTNFGKITSAQNERQVQLAVKLVF
jgi:hypothetical protein